MEERQFFACHGPQNYYNFISSEELSSDGLLLPRGKGKMVNVGVVGIGFMGNMHFNVHRANKRARVVAIADLNEKRLKGDWSDIAGNIGDAAAANVDLSGVATYKEADDLISSADVGLVDICLPTYLHRKYAIKALEAGKNVLCEKPISLSLEDAQQILKASERAKGKFMVAHCIRFWPEYALVKEMVAEGRYGGVLSASFRRLSPTPTWSGDNWLLDAKKSGSALYDLHCHDVDYINYLFGRPQAVSAAGVSHITSGIDHVATNYIYEDGKQVTAEGGWLFPPAFPFEMSFTIVCEEATLDYNSGREKALAIYLADGSASYPEVPPGDGYVREIDYFLQCIEEDKEPEVVTAKKALSSLEIVVAEEEAIRRNEPVKL